MNVYLGQNTEVVKSDGSETKTLLYGINPYVKFETNWLGIGGGIHLGKLIYPISGKNYSGNFKTGLVKTPVFPQIYFRVGPKRWLFIDYHWADQFITPFPVFYQELGLGSGISLGNGTIIRGGLLIPPDDRSVNQYFSAYIPINKDFSLEPMLLFASEFGNQFSLGIHYNLSSKFLYEKKK